MKMPFFVLLFSLYLFSFMLFISSVWITLHAIFLKQRWVWFLSFVFDCQFVDDLVSYYIFIWLVWIQVFYVKLVKQKQLDSVFHLGFHTYISLLVLLWNYRGALMHLHLFHWKWNTLPVVVCWHVLIWLVNVQCKRYSWIHLYIISWI